MSPITGLALQRRAVETGRIRIGRQVTNANGKSRPSKLEAFRFTTGSERVAHAIAAHLGGQVQRWEGAPVGEQWEVFTTATEINVAIPPGDNAVSQWMELWTRGGCARRCDGERETLKNVACPCREQFPDQRRRNDASKVGNACKPTTRISVIIPDLPGIGVFRLETHGWNAAAELAGTAELLAAARGAGVVVPAVLRLSQRQSRTEGNTHNFAVPVLEVINTLREMTALEAGARGLAASLPPAPTAAAAIGAGPSTAVGAAPQPSRRPAQATPAQPPSEEVPRPESAQAVADLAAGADRALLQRLGSFARAMRWEDTPVERKGAYEPLIESIRHRDDELRQAARRPAPEHQQESPPEEYDPTMTEPRDAPAFDGPPVDWQ